MRYTNRCGALIVCALLSGLLAWPATSRAEVNAELTGWLFHHDAPPPCASCAAPTTYAPPYNANRIVWMPSYGITSTCNPLVPQSCGYGVTACLPVSGCGCSTGGCGCPTGACGGGCPTGGCGGGCCPTAGCCGGCETTVAYTTYRPFLSWLFRPFQPYPVYRMAFYAPVVPACGPACCAAPACSACAACSTCPTSACFAPDCPSCAGGSCAAGGCAGPACDGGGGAAPCASCAAAGPLPPAASQQPSLPGPYMNDANPSPINPSPANPPEGTFRQPSPLPSPSAPTPEQKTSTYPSPIGTPASGTLEEPRPMPVGPTAARPIHQATYLLPAAVSVRRAAPPAQIDDSGDGWHEARD